MNPHIQVTQPISLPNRPVAATPRRALVEVSASDAVAPVPIPEPPTVTAALLEKQSVAVCRAQLQHRIHASPITRPPLRQNQVTQPLNFPVRRVE